MLGLSEIAPSEKCHVTCNECVTAFSNDPPNTGTCLLANSSDLATPSLALPSWSPSSILRQHRCLPEKVRQIKTAKNVSFNEVNIYHFNRTQGFICIPSRGGSTLGMQTRHSLKEIYSLAEHERFRRFQRYSTLLRYCLEGKIILSPRQFKILERRVESTATVQNSEIASASQKFLGETCSPVSPLTRGKNESAEFDNDLISRSCDVSRTLKKRKLEDDEDDSFSSNFNLNQTFVDEDLDFLHNLEDYYFMQPLPIKKRRMLLRRAGLEKIDSSEKLDCQEIRLSRTQCGCGCPNGYCEADTCECALTGISCQVDRVTFPCACGTASQCSNPAGRIEFNSIRVKAHYLHTRMQLDLERYRGEMSFHESKLRKSVHLQSDELEPSNGLSNSPTKTDTMISPSNDVSFQDILTESIKSTIDIAPTSTNADGYLSTVKQSSTEGSSSSQQSLFGIDDSTSEAFLAAFNTTLYGCCYHCQNDHYVNLLMKKLAEQEHLTHSNDDQDIENSESSDLSSSEVIDPTQTNYEVPCIRKIISSPANFIEVRSGFCIETKSNSSILNSFVDVPCTKGEDVVDRMVSDELSNGTLVEWHEKGKAETKGISRISDTGTEDDVVSCSNNGDAPSVPLTTYHRNSLQSPFRLDPISSIFHGPSASTSISPSKASSDETQLLPLKMQSKGLGDPDLLLGYEIPSL